MARAHDIVAALAIAAVAAVAGAEEPRWSYCGSLGYSAGDYTLTETTHSFLLYNGLTYRQGRWTLGASIPFIDQDTPFVTYAGGVPVPSGRRFGDGVGGGGDADGGEGGQGGVGGGTGPGGANSSMRANSRRVEVPDPETLSFDDSGVGDPVLRADLQLTDPARSGPRFGVYAAIKPPFANEESGFGTGEWDYGAGLTLSRKSGPILYLADFGYWIFGDLADLELQDPISYSLGVGRTLADGRYSVLGSLSGLTETVDGVDAPAQVAVTVSRITAPERAFNLTLSAGLSESSADYALSTGWRVGI